MNNPFVIDTPTVKVSADINSANTSYADSNIGKDIKAIQFFSKENSTRINIAKQKMLSWVKKMTPALTNSGQRRASKEDKP